MKKAEDLLNDESDGECSRDFTLATSRNGYLPSIGWKGRVFLDGREICKEELDLSYVNPAINY